MSAPLPCFKAYDIRGRIPNELNPDLAYRIGRAYAGVIAPRGAVAVGQDIRLSSPELAQAVIQGLNDAGVNTCSLGLCGTETVYHAASLGGMGGGIMVTASHNPMDYNGMKLVREQAIPISGDTGLKEIERRVREGDPGPVADVHGEDRSLDVMQGYVERVLGFVELSTLRPLHLLVNAGNGAAGPTFDALAARLPFRVTRIHHAPDGRFPNGIPNPLLPENRAVTGEAVVAHGADLGIAWDGDFDRCFVFDERGECVEGYYMVGLLAAQMLEKQPGSRIVHDPRLTWNTQQMVQAAGGVPVMSKTGHAFIKERMRREDALYGGEMSAHHYFRDFSYCDSGMIPWLLTAERMSLTGKPLSALVEERIRAYPCSGEINYRVEDVPGTLERVTQFYLPQGPQLDDTDGLSMEFAEWRFNLRASNTEPVIRLNVEARGDAGLMREKTRELGGLIT
ncbi:phosphomannomutase [Ectothiorhodospira haloalkaliphila]|uniref:phosphomannomutase n=1 Tax=Ectothiorhodospira haloalkaliphila TaxID=421628 RepID=W8L6L1_9GAMM|nr:MULTISPECIES: phosphomannomutase/phosphoglucomutase [Ectothiorhodospira]AHK79510.1 phosphomannomutase [Ectothiorhodospira haloalkaliphila]MCG5495153.1 phosphomannomutase/phosphoglucomutase [Ectothiorhodospira variabilis]MCG5498276.1 phosphomannomutase/phosphoglucomutase [Ectothiorhodospira variabilis]MCG5503847.1 phosphomannomutase/phosphoglucomutase [Ectothiorhodospira variabilis]MCG5507022.1 phosphomannomutase/phosphoglucomutase [Ectothiorhodospira variabilis]